MMDRYPVVGSPKPLPHTLRSNPFRQSLLLVLGSIFLAVLLVGVPKDALADVGESDWILNLPAGLDSESTEDDRAIINLVSCKDEVDGDDTYTFEFALSEVATLESDTEFVLKLAVENEQCDENSIEAADGDECLIVEGPSDLTDGIQISHTLSFRDLVSITDGDLCETIDSTTYLYLVVSETKLGEDTKSTHHVSYRIEFQTQRPDKPTGLALSAGETSIDAIWDELSGVDDYTLFYSSESIDTSIAPEDQPSSVHSVNSTSSTEGNISGLVVMTTYYVALASKDSYENYSFLGAQETIETIEVQDFWEAYSAENPGVESGHCFVATAAYGSYQAPHVKTLRRFRDEYLLTNAPGQSFVAFYYEHSPAYANMIAESETLRSIARWALLPLHTLGLMLIYGSWWTIFGLFSAAALSFSLLRTWLRRRREEKAQAPVSKTQKVLLASLLLASVLLLNPNNAEAQDPDKRYASPVNMMIELKGGSYTPTELGGTFDTFFADSSPTLMELEFDWQFFRWIGSFGVGGSIGYASAEGKGLLADGTQSVDSTSLAWVPLRLHLVYRFDYLAESFQFPFVPYGKIGVNYYSWWINDGSSETSVNNSGAEGSGGTFGWHGILGLSFLLDWVAPSMASTFDMEWGVNNSYIFVEYLHAKVDGLGSSSGRLPLSADSFMFGMALEF